MKNAISYENVLLYLSRPRNNDVTLSLLKRAKENNYSALVVTLDTMSLGWRPHDLETAYIPFAHGVGIQIGKSDPVFMGRFGKQAVSGEHPEFPYDPAKIDAGVQAGDAKIREQAFFGVEWLKEANSGLYRDWEDLKFLRQSWEGPLVLKGIQSVIVRLHEFASPSNGMLTISPPIPGR